MQTHEWFVIFLLLGFLGFLSITSHSTRIRAKETMTATHVKKNITVELYGEIENPGSYQCPIGTSLKELLQRAKIKRCADRKKIPFKKILLSDQRIEVPAKIGEPKKNSLEEK